ncbi:hypothetical protein DV737_g68, partial [Chaetothyriales sp. CBS 132003]
MSRPPQPRSSAVSGFAGPAPSHATGNNAGNTSNISPGHASAGALASPAYHASPMPSHVASRPASRIEPPTLAATMAPMPGTLPNPTAPRMKRLIVACDGTWMDSDNGIINGKKQEPSNVSRLCWALKDTSRDGFAQVVNYVPGVGTSGGTLSRFLGGAVGAGLKANISEAYNYLATNWNPKDELFLIGFSRGAFTARCVGGMVGDFGLLTKDGLPYFNEIFEDYNHRHDDNYFSKFPDIPFPDKGRFDAHYVDQLQARGLTRLRIPIKVIAVWETVGSLGIPKIPILESLHLQSSDMHQYEFYDTRLNPYVENAFQALALDERRGPFSPAVWEKGNNDRVNLKQVWFPGVHSNVGGGYDDEALSDITLAWMMSRLEPFLDFREHYIAKIYAENRAYYKETGQKPRWWGFGELYNSLKGVYTFAGSTTRTPGNYHRIDPYTGRSTGKRLRNTNEYIHASARARIGLQGPGLADRGTYDPPALRDWSFNVVKGQPGNAGGNMVMWTNHAAAETGGQESMPEAMLMTTELALLGMSPRVADYIHSMREPTRERRRRHANPHDPEMTMTGAVDSVANERKYHEKTDHDDGDDVVPLDHLADAGAGAAAPSRVW